MNRVTIGHIFLFTLLLGFYSEILDVSCHVALTFPPARKFDLDFLDNVRTKPPCGMPRGDVVTSLKAGDKFKVTWHLGYPHRGGFRIELLNSDEKHLLDLTGNEDGSNFVRRDATAQSHLVTLPANLTECRHCTIRLIREAREWGSRYKFWSCADVDIVPAKEYREDCSGHGTRSLSGKCRCKKLYTGDRCQYAEECLTNRDCGPHGRCVDIQATTAPSKQCFCQVGFFGPGCSKVSPLKSTKIREGLFTQRDISPNLILFWRILAASGEIEIGMRYKGTGYVAIGWRPKSFGKTCQNFPLIKTTKLLKTKTDKHAETSEPESALSEGTVPQAEAESEAEPETDGQRNHLLKDSALLRRKHIREKRSEIPYAEGDSEAESEGESEAESEGETETESEGKSEAESEGKSEAESEGKSKGESEPESEGKSEPKSEGESEPESKKQSEPESKGESEPESEGESEPEFEGESEPQSEGKSEPESEGKSEPESEGESEPESEGESEPESEGESESESEGESESESEGESEPESEGKSEPESEGESEPESEGESEPESKAESEADTFGDFVPRGEFHAMDCTDMVIGMARGNTFRISDFYTRDRSTPRRDEFWGGVDDLTAAMGFERDGETTIMFRKKINASHASDHSLLDEEMHVIWATGQEQDDYSHRPPSGLEASKVSIANFYRPDEIKYHGRKNRGILSMNFFDEIKQNIGSEAGKNLDFCGGQWVYPRNCKALKDKGSPACEYIARWEFDEASDDINFTISSTNSELWTGIGFSQTPQMSLTDAIIGFVEPNGRFFIMDMWTTGYLQPILESSQDLRNEIGTVIDGVTTLKFTRARNTNDNQDVKFTDSEGLYMIFPVKGGKFDSVNKKLRKHSETPIASNQRIFIKSCKTVDGRSTFTTTPRPKQLMYKANLKFVELGPRYRLPVVGTQEYSQLQNKISEMIGSSASLQNVPGFQTVVITKFKSDNFGEFEAHMLILIDAEAYHNASLSSHISVSDAMENIVEGGTIGNLRVDPQSLKLVEPVSPRSGRDESVDGYNSEGTLAADAEFDSFFSSRSKRFMVVGAAGSLLFIVVFQGFCTVFKCNKNASRNHPENVSNNHNQPMGGPYKDKVFSSQNSSWNQMTPPPPSSSGSHPFSSMPRDGGGQRNYAYDVDSQAPRQSTTSHHRRHNRVSSAQTSSESASADFAPDHYFMPSQRKYSGEVVRVYVDYDK